MRVTVLGCGASAGVPLVGCRCAVCRSDNPKNKRLRVSVLVEEAGKKVLVDTSPDLRAQCLAHDVSQVDAIIFTHDHADHTHGIDDVRSFNYHAEREIPILGDAPTLQALQSRFPYAFLEKPSINWMRPTLAPRALEYGREEEVAGLRVLPFKQLHGKVVTMGLRFGKFAYSTDVNALDDTAFAALAGVDTWMVDSLRYTPSYSHANLELTLSWVARLRPRRAILTHMAHDLDYDTLRRELPPGVEPAYDGMVIDL